MREWGNIPLNSVIPFYFSAFDGGTGASITLTGLAVTDVEIYKGTSMTQRASDSGVVLLDTDGIDVDAITGIHGFSIDTSDNADAGFFAAGSFYTVVVASVTIDAQTVNFVVGTFRLTAAEGVAGVPDVNVTHVGDTAQTAGDIIGDTNDIQARLPAALVSGRIDASVGAMAANVLTAAATAADFGTEIAAAIWDALTSGMVAVGSIGKKLADWVVGTIDTYTGNTKQTGDNFARLGAPAGASVSADIAAVKVDTAAILVDTGTTLDGRIPAALVGGRMDSDIGAKTGNVALSTQEKADVNAEVDTAFTTALADSVPADGSLPTREQAIYMITQFLMERAVSGLTLTVKKVDGSTDLMTFSLDASPPTSITRAT